MTRSDHGSSELTDFTESNQQTYDRIARRYADHQVQLASEKENPYIHLESNFAASLPRGGILADLGCGPAHDGLRFTDKGFQVVGVDLSAGMLRVAAERLDGHLIQGDLRALPLAAGCLDGIWNVASMLHIPEQDTLSVLHEFRRVMKTSGSLGVVTALGDGSAHEAVTFASDESRWFVYRNQASLMTLMKEAGFVVQSETLIQGSRLWLTVMATSV
jgi:ubiquinone/menaquinone biosynthesis C-methylase UbiE